MKQIILSFFLFFVSISDVTSQSFYPIGFDIPGAVGVEVGPKNKVWVVSGGTGSNDGQIMRFTDQGKSETIVSGLPSYFDAELQELKSVLNIYFVDFNRFYVVVGGGPSDDFGVLALFDMRELNLKNGPFVLQDASEIIEVSKWVLAQGYPESNPYAMLINDHGDIIISDAAANAIIKYSPDGIFSTLLDVPSTTNPLPFGPPFMEAVPTQILAANDGGYLVSTLTGFPFATGGANIYKVTEEGEFSIYSSGLTLLTDMAIDPYDGELMALQFANFGPMGFEFGSAQLTKVYKDGAQEIIAQDFGPSAGLAIDKEGALYTSHLFLGQLLKLERFTGCHAPLNLKATQKNDHTYQVSWNRVGAAEAYDVQLSFGDGEFSSCNIVAYKTNITLTSTSSLDVKLKVRPRCGRGVGEFSKTLDISFNHNSKSRGTPSITINDEEFVFEQAEVALFPNPATDLLNVSVPEELLVDQIAIYNIDGKQLFSKQVSSTTANHRLDISSLSVGIYIISTLHSGEVLNRQELVIVR